MMSQIRKGFTSDNKKKNSTLWDDIRIMVEKKIYIPYIYTILSSCSCFLLRSSLFGAYRKLLLYINKMSFNLILITI